MAYWSLYRKWRPRTFAEVVGQEHVVRTLQNALRTGHVAHAYLFAGPRGTGKTTVARLLAKGLNCARGVTPEPCLECESCRRIAAGTSLDCLEIDGASNRGIDEIRELRERSKFAPQEGPYKIYIIDEVHMLTTEAFNALLKTLEEPPPHVVFVLATTEAHKVPPTILSRCQRFDFRRFGEDRITEHLRQVAAAEGIQISPEALRLIARHAEGGMRDALGLLEQCLAYAQGTESGAQVDEAAVSTVLGLVPEELIGRFIEAAARRDLPGALGVVDEVFASGADARQFVHSLAQKLRERVMERVSGPQGQGEALRDTLSVDDLLRWGDYLAGAEVELRAGASPRFILDLTVLRLVLGEGGEGAGDRYAERLAALEAKVARLEERLKAGPEGVATGPEEVAAGGLGEGLPEPRRRSEAVAAGRQEQADSDGERLPHVEPPAGGEMAALDQPVAGGERAAVPWPDILNEVRRRNIQVHALLREARPHVLREGTLHLILPDGLSFHKNSLEQPRVMAMLERVISRQLRMPVRLQFHLGDRDLGDGDVQKNPPGLQKGEGAPASGSRQPEGGAGKTEVMSARTESESSAAGVLPPSAWPEADALLRHPLVQKALELFEGRVVQVMPARAGRTEKVERAERDDRAGQVEPAARVERGEPAE